jgi:tetratricopeptide (TPR) repeat protein
MLLNWFNAREATDVGTALADDFVLQTATHGPGKQRNAAGPANEKELQKFLQKFLQQIDRDVQPLRLNVFKRAKLANSFKWRLLEKGVEREIADELTQAMVLRLSARGAGAAPSDRTSAGPARRPGSGKVHTLLVAAEEHLKQGAYVEAANCYEQFLALEPRHAAARNNLGVALSRLGQYKEAEAQFRRAIGIKPNYPEAHFNLGNLLRAKGLVMEAEMPLRRALKLKPAFVDAQISLGRTLIILGRVSDARVLLEKAVRLAPRHLDALLALGFLSGREGRFSDAESFFKRALEIDAKAGSAWSGLAHLRKMTADDSAWLKGAQASVDSGVDPLTEANLHFAIGKYYNDVGDFTRAFRSYQRANELTRTGAEPYDRDARKRFVDDQIRAYSREALAQARSGASDSVQPVLVVGMPRSGTSLVEQIIASHPAVRGAGELSFWVQAVRKHATSVLQGPPDHRLTGQLAQGYLRVLGDHAADALRVVDKAPFNTDYLGMIHGVFPKARMIYVRRDPIDTCLSCYFQDFLATLNFTLDLSDLAHYYREHHRLVEHWRNALPAGTMLDVPYAELIKDQERWTRRIVEFLGLEWDARCLNFHQTERSVLTASYWQVRQTMYQTSAGRWRNYEKFIGPLLALKGLE